MATPVTSLYGDGVSPDKIADVAKQHSLAVANGTPVSREHSGVLLLAQIDSAKFPTQLTEPYAAYVEVIDGAEDLDAETICGINEGKLCFSFATSTAYQIDSAAYVCEALAARGILTPMKRADVELSLHETISNAVVHGNLNLASNMKGSASYFAAFAQELQHRMASPDAKRRVNIIASWDNEFLDISVSDQGQGYDESKLPANVDPFAPAGRGLAIIRSLTLAMNVTHGGRITTLRFVT